MWEKIHVVYHKYIGKTPASGTSYRSCQGILSFASKVGNDRLDKACHRALLYRDYSYMTIKTILERKWTRYLWIVKEGKIMPLHSNIRGNYITNSSCEHHPLCRVMLYIMLNLKIKQDE